MCTGTNVQANLGQVTQQIELAAARGCQCVVLPENFALMGAASELKQQLAEPPGQGSIQKFLADLARTAGLYIVAGTILTRSPTGKLNAACGIYDPKGDQIHCYHKMHLFDVQLSAQERYAESDEIEPGQEQITFNIGPFKIAPAICYDIRFPEFFRKLSSEGVHLFVVPAAFTETTGRAHWEILLRARAIENQCFVAAANQTGRHQDNRQTFGHSMIVDPWGEILVQAEKQPTLLVSELDMQRLLQVRQNLPALTHRLSVWNNCFTGTTQTE